MVSEAQKKAQQKYDSANTVKVTVKLNRKTDRALIDKLDSVDNKAGYIKALIRADI